jgi:hypothetical protein
MKCEQCSKEFKLPAFWLYYKCQDLAFCSEECRRNFDFSTVNVEERKRNVDLKTTTKNKLYCPQCGKEVKTVFTSDMKEPFTTYSPMEGLTLWGPYSADKGPVCRWEENGKWRVHFWERIVKQV